MKPYRGGREIDVVSWRKKMTLLFLVNKLRTHFTLFLIFAEEKDSPSEIGVVDALEKVAGLLDELHDLGLQLLGLGLDILLVAAAEEHGLHLEQMLEQERVHLCDQLEEGHAADQGNVVRIPAQDDQGLEQKFRVLHRLQGDGSLIAFVFTYNKAVTGRMGRVRN